MILADVYDPAVTAVLARAIVPVVVIVPPLNPVPAVILVTVPVLVVYPDGLVAAYAPISDNVQETFPEPLTDLPVFPIVKVLPVVHVAALVAVAAFPEILIPQVPEAFVPSVHATSLKLE